MKGISIPVNVAIVAVICVICLAVIILAIYFFQPKEDWDLLYSIACTRMTGEYFCRERTNGDYTVDRIEVQSGDKKYTMWEICVKRGVADKTICRCQCPCPC